jgi:hypothetical protein
MIGVDWNFMAISFVASRLIVLDERSYAVNAKRKKVARVSHHELWKSPTRKQKESHEKVLKRK